MAVIKCKMCGGDLVIEPGSTVAECEFCGSKQTIPNQDDDKKLTLFARANRLRMGSEFDKAAGIYESIVADFPEEAEAYWGLVLCKYGIEYVDDPASGKKIPTCHRSSFDSVMEDADFEQALENADGAARRVYRDEAKAIEEIRKGIIEVSGKEEPYDIFICYKETDESGDRTIDSVIAQDAYDALTAKGYRVFFSRITLEDKLGQEYEPYIFAALNSAKIMLAFGTDYEYYNAVWVKNEWSRYLKLMAKDKSKHLIPCYKNIDAYDMPKEFAKLQAQDMGKVGAMQDLLRGIEKILPKAAPVIQPVALRGPNVDALLSRGFMALEDGAFQEAAGYFNNILNSDPKCAQAYFGLFMADIKAKNQVQTSEKFIAGNYTDNRYYQRCKQFADSALRAELTGWEQKVQQKKEADEKLRRERIEALQIKQKELKKKRDEIAACQNIISAGYARTVGLKSDGSTVAIGLSIDGECSKLSKWKDVLAVSDYLHTVGVKLDGTVVVVGNKESQSECNVTHWSNIIAVSAGENLTVGLKADGTVVAAGDNKHGKCNVSEWKDIVAVSAGGWYTVGLKNDGTVVAVGNDTYGECNVASWRDIVAISTSRGGAYPHTVGLKSDGTVVATGKNASGQCDVTDWKDIVAISAGHGFTVGLRMDGTVVVAGEKETGRYDASKWTDIVAVSTGPAYHVVGLKSDGTVVSVGDNRANQCDVSGWKLAENPLNFRDELMQGRKIRLKAERVELDKKLRENAEKIASCKAKLAELHGLFSGIRRKELQNEIEKCEAERAGITKQIEALDTQIGKD